MFQAINVQEEEEEARHRNFCYGHSLKNVDHSDCDKNGGRGITYQETVVSVILLFNFSYLHMNYCSRNVC